jgi:Holliday junction resolvasome RuvABC ATP-dependent DNA helicase subunit
MEDNQKSKEQNKIVSIVGFGGLGKTTLANVVYEKLRPQFDCSAFVSVSQCPDMEKLFKDMFYQLANYSTASINVVDELRGFLQEKRYGYITKTSHQFIISWNFCLQNLALYLKSNILMTFTNMAVFLAQFNATQVYIYSSMCYTVALFVGCASK